MTGEKNYVLLFKKNNKNLIY
jgi:hypothetical protein